MGRKTCPDIKKLEKIREILKKNQSGLWVREIARKTKLDKSLVSRYINKYLKREVKIIYQIRKRLLKIVKLK